RRATCVSFLVLVDGVTSMDVGGEDLLRGRAFLSGSHGPLSAYWAESVDVGPSVRGPLPGRQGEPEIEVRAEVGGVVVVGEDVPGDGLASGAGDGALLPDQEGATAFQKGYAVGVEVGAGDVGGAADDDLVVGTDLAAGVPGHEQVVVAVAVDDVGRLHRVGRLLPVGQMDGLGPVGDRPGGPVEFDHVDTAPEGTESHPVVPVGVLDDAGVDGVVVVAAVRLDDGAVVDPLVVGVVGVEDRVGGQADDGAVVTEGGCGVVEVESAVG